MISHGLPRLQVSPSECIAFPEGVYTKLISAQERSIQRPLGTYELGL